MQGTDHTYLAMLTGLVVGPGPARLAARLAGEEVPKACFGSRRGDLTVGVIEKSTLSEAMLA